MATTNTTDSQTAELSNKEKILAGLLLILSCIVAIVLILGYWPDRLPTPQDNLKPLYINEIFHVRLACIPSSYCCVDSFFARKETQTQKQDSTKAHGLDSTKLHKTGSAKVPAPGSAQTNPDSAKTHTSDSATTDTSGKMNPDTASAVPPPTRSAGKNYSLIDLNVLLMFLVAVGGFLGNMIHIATSFTAFVGSGTFNRRWILWYFVKPFTAACLALGLYFVFRAGFLNYSADPTGINLYGIMTIAILAGLFTDKATLKLGEIFEVVFTLKKDGKSGDTRPDPLIPAAAKFNKITPDILSPTDNNTIVITGENLDKTPFGFTINDEALAADKVKITASTITIQYQIPATQAGKNEFVLTVTDEKKAVVFTHTFGI